MRGRSSLGSVPPGSVPPGSVSPRSAPFRPASTLHPALAVTLLILLVAGPAVAAPHPVLRSPVLEGLKRPEGEAPPAPPTAPADSFAEILDVELVTVPFYAVDRDGAPVYDLEPSEIELWMDGERMDLDFFDRYGAAESVAISGEAREASDPEHLLPLATPRHVFLLFDLAFSTPRGLEAGKRTAEQLLGLLPESDWLYLLTYHTQQGFEQKLGPLAADAAGKAAVAERFIELRPNVERIRLQSQVPPIARGKREAGNVDAAYIDMHATEKAGYRAEAYALADSLESFSTFLRQVQGPKLLLYFTQGIDSQLYLQGLEGRFPPIRLRFDPVMETLGETGTMLLFVNAEVHTEAGVDELTTFDHEADATFVNSLPRGENALARMAEVSGGLVLAHSNTRVLRDRIVEWTSAYYEVGYYPRDGRSPERSAQPEIRLGRPGVEVWSPKFVKTRRRYEELSDREKQFIIADLVLRGPRGQAAREVGSSHFYRLDGHFGGQIEESTRKLTFEALWPAQLRFKALELYSVVIAPGEGLLDGRLLYFDGQLVSPSTDHTTLDVAVPAGGEIVWGIVAVEPVSRALYVRRMMVRPDPSGNPAPVGETGVAPGSRR